MSPEFYFPLWHKYYSSHFGADNLFVISHGAPVEDFSQFRLGGVWTSHSYNNKIRSELMSHLCSMLLKEYHYVIRVDTDEFLIPDPLKFKNIYDYVAKLQRPYVTSFGYNVVSRDKDDNLNFSESILARQRKFCYAYDALNKTCIISVETSWAPGFHFASVYPEFCDLFLFHLKFADIDMQVGIGAAVSAQSDELLFQNYHSVSREKIVATMESVFSFPNLSGWLEFRRPNYNSNFLRGIMFVPQFGGVYHGGPFMPEMLLLEIPAEFEKQL